MSFGLLDDQSTLVTTVTSISNSFISTLDHLPCDIVRSVWLIQSLNLAIDDNLKKLDQLITSGKDAANYVAEISNIKLYINRLKSEAEEECKYLIAGLTHHKRILMNDTSTMRELIKLREDNLFKNNKDNFKAFKKQYIARVSKDSPTSATEDDQILEQSRKTRSVVNPTLDTQQQNKMDQLKQLVNKQKKIPIKLKIKTPQKGTPQSVQPNKEPKHKVEPKMKPEDPEEEEEVYCFCRKGDSGRMIACDSPKCKIEWFHYRCVGLKANEKSPSSWYCPDCASRRAKKKGNTTKKAGEKVTKKNHTVKKHNTRSK